MSDFRTKLLGLTSLAIAFAGVSYGQVSCTGGTQTLSPVAPIELRAESQTELVSDIILNCPASGVIANGQLTIFSSLPVTSKAQTGLGGTANSEAVLTLTNNGIPLGVGNPVIYNGTVSGTVVSFTGINFPANFTAQLSNIRVNASSAGAGATPVPVTESVFAGTNGQATLVQNNIIVGYALKSLATPAFTVNAQGNPIITNYTVCAGNPVSAVAGGATPSLSFTAIVAETFGGAFKLQTSVGNPTNQEQGSYAPTPATPSAIGSASSGTEISLTFANVPASATIYVPLTATNGTLTLTLTGSPTVATTPAGLTVGGLPAILGPAPDGPVAFTPTAGTVTATYQVTASSAANVETVNIPVYVSFAANSAAAQGPITVLEAYAPTSATLAGPAPSVPLFVVPTNSPLNGSSVSLCQTTLLFPYLTNSTGFETGIAVSNTSTDNLGKAGASLATPTPGTCTLNFYGNQAQPTAFTTPTVGAWSTAAGSPSPVYANTLTAMTGASNFTGYAIALCQFLDAHGFGFIVDSSGTFSGNMGYLAIVIPNTALNPPAREGNVGNGSAVAK